MLLTTPPFLTRRTSLKLAIGGLVLPATLKARRAFAETDGPEVHGLSTFGDLGLPKDFPHLAYVNPAAPKGGELVLQVTGTFNTLNNYTLLGVGVPGVSMCFDKLMLSNNDEPDAMYGLVARGVRVSADKLSYRFILRKEARFSDGTPLTAADIVFSLKTLADPQKSDPSYWNMLGKDLDSATVDGDDVIVRLKPGHSRDAILVIVDLPIFSQAFYAKVAFEKVSLEPPIGSGAFKIGKFEQGKYIVLERVQDYWANSLPINLGTNNFDRIRFEYYADRTLAFEGFKAGDFTYHEEARAVTWATGYNIPAVTEGRILRKTLPDAFPTGMQGWLLNVRRDKFKDPRVREALGYAFDFTWTNANVMYGAYKRTVSYFQNSPMQATGAPSAEELKILEPHRQALPPDVFGPAYLPPDGDGTGSGRTNLRKAFQLLSDAGCKRDGEKLMLASGQPLEIEFLNDEAAFQPHTLPFIRNLNLLGISANFKLVDEAQYDRLKKNFDYDIIIGRQLFGLTPGVRIRDAFGSEAAKIPGTINLSGVADPVLDALIAQAIVAPDRDSLTILCRCIDRVLRAGHYWVPMWNKNDHTIAFWNLFGWPDRAAKYGLNVETTWWYDEEKAKTTALKPR